MCPLGFVLFLFGLICILLGLVDGSFRVVRRRVDSVEFGFPLRDVYHVVPGPGGHDYRVAVPSSDLLLSVVKDKLEFSLLYAKELVNVRVHFVANLLSLFEAHHNELFVLSRVQDLPEVFVLQRLFFDRSKVPYHLAFSSFSSCLMAWLIRRFPALRRRSPPRNFSRKRSLVIDWRCYQPTLVRAFVRSPRTPSRDLSAPPPLFRTAPALLGRRLWTRHFARARPCHSTSALFSERGGAGHSRHRTALGQAQWNDFQGFI